MTSEATPPISGATRIYCIVGDPIVPVRSPAFYNEQFRRSGADAVFIGLEIPAAEAERGFAGLRAMRNVAGIVVTMPLKKLFLGLVDEALPTARLVGAVNTIRREADGRLVGDMFDGKGGVLGLQWHGHDPRGRRVLLVGAGGAGGALAFALAEAGTAELTIADRDAARAEDVTARVRSAFPACRTVVGPADPRGHAIAINATPLGMKPGDPMSFDPARLDPGAMVFDIINNPDPSALTLAARARGCPAIGGRAMYEGQAVYAARFLGIPIAIEGRPS